MTLVIEKLTAAHAVGDFSCGRPALDAFLHKHALMSQAANAARTYVAVEDGATVVGFHSLTVGHVAHVEAPERLARGLARHPVPVMVLARLAVRVDRHGKGLGAGLLRDAILRTVQAAEIAGIRALVVHAKDDAARAFYDHFGFSTWPDNPFHLFLLLKDARAGL